METIDSGKPQLLLREDTTNLTRVTPRVMPGEAGAKGPNRGLNRWEGTHTYARGGSKPRTVGQAQEEAAARIKADREKRRIGVEKLRRNSIAAFPSSSKPSNLNSDPEEEFFDADEMPGSNKKKRQASGR